MSDSAYYEPGAGTAFVSPDRVLLVAEVAGPTDRGKVWALLSSSADVPVIVDQLITSGIASAPDFALVAREDGRLRVVIRGAAQIDVVRDGERTRSIAADDLATWAEQLLDLPCDVVLSLGGQPTETRATTLWPVAGGVVPSCRVSWSPVGTIDASPPGLERPADAVVPTVHTDLPVEEASKDQPPGDDGGQLSDLRDPVAAVDERPTEPESSIISEPETHSAQDRAAPVSAAPESRAHDGRTVSRQSLGLVGPQGRAHDGRTAPRVTADATPEGLPRTAPTGVPARSCPEGHENPPDNATCRECGTSVDRAAPVHHVTEPVVCVLRFQDGSSLPLRRPLYIGRKPSISRVTGADLPDIHTVPQELSNVSRTHLEIRPDGWRVVAIDKGSSHGSRVRLLDGAERSLQHFDPEQLAPGSVITLGGEYTVTVASC